MKPHFTSVGTNVIKVNQSLSSIQLSPVESGGVECDPGMSGQSQSQSQSLDGAIKSFNNLGEFHFDDVASAVKLVSVVLCCAVL